MRSKNFFLGGRFRTFNLGASHRTRPRFDSVAPGGGGDAAPGQPPPLSLAQRLKLERAGQPAGRFRTRYDPRLLAKYDVKALVGRGTYSRVVRAESRLTRRPVAIKMIDVTAGKSSARDTFDSELRILRKLRHPNIIQLVEVFESPEKLYLVLELATGGDLFDQIQARGVFSERDGARVLRMVLDGVRYLHGVGVTHRDLKPDNVLYYHPGADSKVLITDFGLAAARQRDEDIYMYTPCGTPEYIAPEVVTRRPYTCSVDLWAVGVTAFIMLSGTFPFENNSRLRLYKLIMRAKFSFEGEAWASVSETAKGFISSLLDPNPVSRLSAERALREPWFTQQSVVPHSHTAFKSRHRNRPVASPPQPGARAPPRAAPAGAGAAGGPRVAPQRARRSGKKRKVKPRELDKLQFDADVFLYQYEMMSRQGKGAPSPGGC
ncbi:serine/threonine-protein kinase H1-like [Amphibalanus amphitrite]|uniref:serine/threonine-protein kinase H1-like n=1 Tax=Amphibalanus amphitrite TaxID=1232801 RepID=UPI001C90E79C|nr:serine/threonine-protein kinase H1-like [Amphibalanus amphitrite]